MIRSKRVLLETQRWWCCLSARLLHAVLCYRTGFTSASIRERSIEHLGLTSTSLIPRGCALSARKCTVSDTVNDVVPHNLVTEASSMGLTCRRRDVWRNTCCAAKSCDLLSHPMRASVNKVRRVPAPAPRQNVLPKTRGNILTGCDFGRPQRKIAFGFLALFLLLWGGLRFHHQETESKRRSRQKMFELESMVKEAKAELAKTKISPEPQLHGQRQVEAAIPAENIRARIDGEGGKSGVAKTKISPEPQLHGQRQDIQCHPLPAINLLSGGYRQLLQRRPILSEQQVHSLPRLAFVISMDVRMYCTYAAVLSASSCYGARHGIPVFVETVQLQTDRHYFQSRTVHIMKYLQASPPTLVVSPLYVLAFFLGPHPHPQLSGS
jgi:hypothetical protein